MSLRKSVGVICATIRNQNRSKASDHVWQPEQFFPESEYAEQTIQMATAEQIYELLMQVMPPQVQ